MLVIKKFGGSSLESYEKLKRAAELAAKELENGNKTVLVVSARGRSTDELENTARMITADIPPRERAALLSTGEMQSAALMAIMLRSLGIPALSLSGAQAGIKTESRYDDAAVTEIDTSRLLRHLSAGEIPVVCGFQGADDRGDVCTLGRGGSDTTAVLLAGALKAERCEIFTDVDGVYTADPRIVSSAVRHDALDYDDMLALAGAGAKVLHDKCVRAAKQSGIKILVLPAFKDGSGTLITNLPHRAAFAGVSALSDGSISVIGTAADEERQDILTAALSDAGIPVLYAESRDSEIKIKTAPKDILRAVKLIHEMMPTD